MSATREVKLPEELCKKVEELYGMRFGTLDEFLTMVLQELAQENTSRADQAEQQIIEERLKDLGYV